MNSYLEIFRVRGRNSLWTHTSWSDDLRGKFCIPDDRIDEFMDIYQSEVNLNKPLCLNERHREFGQIIVDVDITYSKKITHRLYNQKHILEIIEAYSEEINNLFQCDEIIAYIFERMNPYQKGYLTKDGFHIMFPNIISRPNIQYLLLDRVEERFKRSLGISSLCIIDRNVIDRTGWLMYGSSKPGRLPYLLTQIYSDKKLTYVTSNNLLKEPAKFFSIRRFGPSDATPLTPLGIELLEEQRGQLEMTRSQRAAEVMVEEDADEVTNLVRQLSPQRAEQYMEWIDVGFCLFNISIDGEGIGNDSMLRLWIEFSRQSSKFQIGECEDLWYERFKPHQNMRIDTLRAWVLSDQRGDGSIRPEG